MKLFSSKCSLLFSPFFLVMAILIEPIGLFGQSDEWKQSLSSFVEWASNAGFEEKALNVTEPKWGSLNNSNPDFQRYIQFKSKEKREDNLERTAYFKWHLALYAFDETDDYLYARKDWLNDFLENKTLRPGKDFRVYEYGKPGLVLFTENAFVIFQMECSQYFEEEFRTWTKAILKHFADENTSVIEIGCNGPLKWIKNAPDPKAWK